MGSAPDPSELPKSAPAAPPPEAAAGTPPAESPPPGGSDATPQEKEDGFQKYFRYRGWTPIPIYGAAFFLKREPRHGLLQLGIGLGLALLGCLFRLWAIRHIGRSARTRTEKTRPLIATGPYAAMRNPLYLANVMIAAGFFVGLGLAAWAALLTFLLALHYHIVVLCEERGLRRRRGADYEAYTARVPRWFPRLWAPGVWGTSPHTILEALYRERSGMLGLLAALAALVAWKWRELGL
jgi:protein-S-isoprenylcysteine O-methyltransferase Ste14